MRRPARYWRDLSIRRKALVVLAIPLAPLVFTAGLYLLTSAAYEFARTATERAWQARVSEAQLYALVIEAESTIRGYLLGRDRAVLDRHHVVRREIAARLAELESDTTAPQQRARAARLRQLIDERLRALDGVMASDVTSGVNSPAMMAEVRRGAAAMTALRTEMEALRAEQGRVLAARADRVRAARARIDSVVLAGAGFGVIGGLVAVLLFSSQVSTRLGGATENLRRLAHREPLLPIPPAGDEIGQVKEGIRHADQLLSDRDAQLQQRMHDLEALTRELEAFSYSVSHDLRAPLRHIAGFASLLEKSAGTNLTDQQHRYIRTISGAAATMGRLIDDLLSFSRTSRAELRVAPVDVSAVVADVKHRLTQAINGRVVHWRIAPLPTVNGDAAMLRVVFDNLLSNAVKYTRTRERAEIEVGARAGGTGETVLFVRDNGVGFDMQYQDKLFGVFQRLHSSDDFEGTGIGLATVRRIVARHGGRAWAEGRPNEGATFYVALPAQETQP